MEIESTTRQKQDRAGIKEFVRKEIIPFADLHDREERTPRELIQKMARQGFLGALLPTEWGGSGMDMVSLGSLHEEIGYGCSSARSLLTVHSMVSYAILKWGSR